MSEFPKQRVAFGAFEADLQTQELWKYGRKLKLGGQPFGILVMLLERPGELVTRDALRDRLWSADTFVDFNQGLNAAVNKLRDCLSDSADSPRYIETLPRRGYRFIGEVSQRPPAPLHSPASPFPPGSAEAIGSSAATSGPADAPAHRVADPLGIGPARNVRTQAVPSVGIALPYRSIAIAVCVAFVAVAAYRMLVPRRILTPGREGGPVFLGGSPRPASDPAFSPDGNRIAFRRIETEGGAPGIFVSTLGGERELKLTGGEGDCCPAWSPDGKRVAFTQRDGAILNILIVPSEGGEVKKVYSVAQKYGHGEIGWSPDGASLAFSADGVSGGAQIFALSLATRTVHPVSEPREGDIDWGPSFSPDGSQMSFIRSNAAGFPEDLYVRPAGSGAPTAEQRMTSGKARILGPPAWTSDSQSIVYSSSKDGEARLWKIPAKGGIPEALPGAGVPSWHPSIPSHGTGLAFQHILGATSIWRLELADVGQREQLVVISTEGRNEAPQLSPNGKKLAFMSDRAGSMEIWISDPDGSYPIRLTDLGGCGSPRWSPDSTRIAFDSIRDGSPAVYLVDASGTPPIRLVSDNSQNMVPSWSRDGRWIYFASDRSGDDEVWKVPVAGGAPLQATREGGFAALESPDGKTLYYAKSRYERPEIWQVPAQGGKESLVTPLVRPGGWANWAITERGIYFVDDVAVRNPNLEFFDFETRKVESLLPLGTSSFWLSVSDDGRSLWYGQAAHNESSIMVQPNFQ